MAVVKLGEVLIGLRGTIGGITFSANGSSAYAKRLVTPVRRRTDLQVAKRGWFTQIRQDWSACNEGQIADWNALATSPPEVDINSLGDTILLSGSAWHTRVNMRRLQAGQAIERNAPVNASVSAPATFGLVVYDFADGVSNSVFSYTEDDFDGFYAALFLSPTLSPVRQVQTTGYANIWCGSVEGDTETRINEELQSAFGWIRAGQKVFGELRKQSTTGIRSMALTTSCIVQEVA